MGTRIGPQMNCVRYYVAKHPGCCKLDVAAYILPRAIGRNNAYAYGPVNRAIRTGIIDAINRGNRYELFVAGCDKHDDCKQSWQLAQECAETSASPTEV